MVAGADPENDVKESPLDESADQHGHDRSPARTAWPITRACPWCRSYCVGLSAALALRADDTGPAPDICRAERMEATAISAISSRQTP